MEVPMLLNPYIAARLALEHRSELEAQARRYRLQRQATSVLRVAKPRVPAQLPRHWRWRYL